MLLARKSCRFNVPVTCPLPPGASRGSDVAVAGKALKGAEPATQLDSALVSLGDRKRGTAQALPRPPRTSAGACSRVAGQLIPGGIGVAPPAAMQRWRWPSGRSYFASRAYNPDGLGLAVRWSRVQLFWRDPRGGLSDGVSPVVTGVLGCRRWSLVVVLGVSRWAISWG